jgi:hypothetical protein
MDNDFRRPLEYTLTFFKETKVTTIYSLLFYTKFIQK